MTFTIDANFTYLLKQAEVGLLHEELASGYKSVIVYRAKDAIKNMAGSTMLEEYFEKRQSIEKCFANAASWHWKDSLSTHCTLDQLHIGWICIRESFADRQLESCLQNENNDMELLLQKAQFDQENTMVEGSSIHLENIFWQKRR